MLQAKDLGNVGGVNFGRGGVLTNEGQGMFFFTFKGYRAKNSREGSTELMNLRNFVVGNGKRERVQK